jgi:hypothetical protein
MHDPGGREEGYRGSGPPDGCYARLVSLPEAAIQPVNIAIEPGSGRSGVLAYAKIFMASAAGTLNVAGVVIVGASGQRIMITLGSVGGLDQHNLDGVAAWVVRRRGAGWDDLGKMEARHLCQRFLQRHQAGRQLT